MNRKEELEFGKQMNASPDKKEVAELVANYNRKNVLDLGAGTGIISQLVVAKGIKATAVDNNFKAENLKSTDLLTYFSMDLVSYIKYFINEGFTEKYDCIILSAVLHELNKKEFNYLKKNLYKVMTDDCIIIIREPYYNKVKSMGVTYYEPYFRRAWQDLAVEEIENVTCPRFKELFRSTKKVSERKVPYPIEVLNMAFTFSYGEASWEREVNEYRFTFSYKELADFCNKAYKNTCFILKEVKFDVSYKKYFKACSYSENVLNAISYTNGLLIAIPSKYNK